MINSRIRASYWMTFPLTIINFNHFFIQPAPGVVHLGISDHSLIFAIRKLTLPKSGKTSPMVREVRDFKNFVQNDFIHDISQLPWDSINQFSSPNTSWQVWKSLFLETLDRHAPRRQKRLRQNRAIPWPDYTPS